MKYLITDRSPAPLFRFFEDISAIPRQSYHEEQIADYLVAFANTRGLEYYRDEHHNVLIKAPATKGMEGKAPILFQGHTDMVCEKNADTEHEFLKDGLELYLDGNLLRAKGTTLGADNGVAVAAMLALLDGVVKEHPAYECLFTSAEEVGLDGAKAFDYSRVSARRMVNMDGGGLGAVIAGCAGGIRSDLRFAFSPVPFEGEAISIKITGLMGGHSGENINNGRANANKLIGRMLGALCTRMDVHLVSVSGGSKDNAIPRECEAVVSVANADEAIDFLSDLASEIASALHADDRNFRVAIESAEQTATMLSLEDTARAIAVMRCVANGILAMNYNIPSVVEYSRNLGVVTTEGDEIKFVFSSRSAMESRLDASIQELEAIARVTGCTTNHHNRYPGWDYAKVSPLRDAYLAAYHDVTGKDAVVNVIHAGLECGIIRSNVPDMDMISIGPNTKNIHSPDEALDLDSYEIFWKTIVRLIETL